MIRIVYEMLSRIFYEQFQQNSMRSRHYDQISCQFCYQTTSQQKIFLFCLLKQLRVTINHPQFLPQQQRLYQPQRQGLARLAQLTSMNKLVPTPNRMPCLHIKWLRSIGRQLGINIDSIDGICHRLANRVAERRYQLYLLEMQTKNAGQTVQKLMNSNKLQSQEKNHEGVQPQDMLGQEDRSKAESRPLPTAIAINATDLNLQIEKSSERQEAASANNNLNPLHSLQKRP